MKKNNRSRHGFSVIVHLGLLLASTAILTRAADLESGNGYIRRRGNSWVIGTTTVEKTITFNRGNLILTSFRNKQSQREFIQGNARSAEIRLNADGKEINGTDGRWVFVWEKAHKLAQGELQLDLTLHHSNIEVSKHYVIYPGTSIIREWLTVSNVSSKPVRLTDPFFLESHLLSSEVDSLQLYYVTGGGNYNGSQLLKMEKIGPDYQKTLDSFIGIQKESYSAYLPLVAIYNPHTGNGVMAGWDYLGHWVLQIGNHYGRPLNLSIKVAGYSKELGQGQSIETPKAFTGSFVGDIDVMGNLLLDWQYQYMWNSTNPDYFAKTRWAVDWPGPWVGKGGVPSADNWGRRLALDLRYVDLMRRTGGDILWDDAGWYDKWGSWNGPEWHLTNDYLAKHSMKWVLWYPTFLATRDSTVGQQHPEWLIPRSEILEQSTPATVDWQKDLLDSSVVAWGNFQWRYDIAPAVSGNETDYLKSDQNFRSLLQRFKDSHPESGVDACFNGGRWISYDLARLCESGEYTDGGVGPYSNYYTSLLVPPDKLHNVVDFDHTYYNDSSDRTHLSMNPTWYRDPGDGPDLEKIRKDWEIYHYMVAQGVAGRWSHVFRPVVEGDDPIWYFQRMSRDSTKGVIITKHTKVGPSYYLVSKPIAQNESDSYYGGPLNMSKVTTSGAAVMDTGIYQDPWDNQYRFYGVPGETYGPLNFKYQGASGDTSFVTSVMKLGEKKPVTDRFFGMAIQVDKNPIIITHLGQYSGDGQKGLYTLMVVRAEDGVVIGSTDLDLGKDTTDILGFKYSRLKEAIRLDPTSNKRPVLIKPRGLNADLVYDVRCAISNYRTRRTGRDLLEHGIKIETTEASDLIFLNLPVHPGSGLDRTAPSPPLTVTKRLGTNLGVQGVEISWKPGSDNNWISYYEILKDGKVIDKVAKGTFVFYYQGNAREQLPSRYEVRTIDGDGNYSPSVTAQEIGGEPEIYRALGGYSPTQGGNNWKYEESEDEEGFREMRWSNGGYEGQWIGSGPAKVGRTWMQPGAHSNVARTFVVPTKGSLTIFGSIRKDPSSANGRAMRARIILNDQQLWPARGWGEIPPLYTKEVQYRLENINAAPGDELRFILQHSGYTTPDTVIWDPQIIIER